MTEQCRARLTVGLTGGIGSGKSAAAERFVQLGAGLVDTDAIAHALTAAGGAAIAQIRRQFGPGVIDPQGALERPAMRELAFSDPNARQRLEAILHPLIRIESERLCAASSSAYVILAIPLLIESGDARARCDRVCVVDCPIELQIARVQARNQLDEAQIRAIIATQARRESRLAAADDVIDNSGTRAALHRQVDALHARYLVLAGAL